MVSGSLDTSVMVWSVKTGKRMRVFMGHNGSVLAVTFVYLRADLDENE